MIGFYVRCMDAWERRLATRDTNRKVRQFEWGLEWITGAHANGNSPQLIEEYVGSVLADSDRFFSYRTPQDYRLEKGVLHFTSALGSPYPENNTVYADFFPVRNRESRAVVVLPQWNSGAEGHVGLCKLLNRFGIAALRMSLAYHDRRMPAELERADYHCSANIGRTIHANRQSIIDVRSCLDWLQSRGYQRLGILGTSLGSCVAFITLAHDPRIHAGVFNHVSMYFSDVVWTGLSTRHIRAGFGDAITQDQLRRYWSVISPAAYLDRLKSRTGRNLLIWARHDSSFLPKYSLQVLEYFRENHLPHEVFTLPCGHYTTGQFPFNIIDGLAMSRFLAHNL
jgi:pimeloyl-ACP methyl ester carboxylesterase